MNPTRPPEPAEQPERSAEQRQARGEQELNALCRALAQGASSETLRRSTGVLAAARLTGRNEHEVMSAHWRAWRAWRAAAVQALDSTDLAELDLELRALDAAARLLGATCAWPEGALRQLHAGCDCGASLFDVIDPGLWKPGGLVGTISAVSVHPPGRSVGPKRPRPWPWIGAGCHPEDPGARDPAWWRAQLTRYEGSSEGAARPGVPRPGLELGLSSLWNVPCGLDGQLLLPVRCSCRRQGPLASFVRRAERSH